jgi:peptidyl-tRNA hydrolase, PTH1 family
VIQMFERLFKLLSFRTSQTEVISDMADIRIVFGLGNPGKEYDGTRHNVGFNVVDVLAEKLGIEVKSKKYASVIGEGNFEGKKVLLIKPGQYMNRSGQVVATVCGFYKLSTDDIIVVTDDMALEPGRIRLRAKGSSGGHNGLKDIIQKLGGDTFSRVRVGIGKSPFPDSRNFVLGKPRPEERDLIQQACQKSAESVLCWMRLGIDAAMNKFNMNSES